METRTTTYMSLRRDFALSLILGLRNVQFGVIFPVASTRGLKRISIKVKCVKELVLRFLPLCLCLLIVTLRPYS